MKEMVKAPLLIVHYLDHLGEYPDMTLRQFYFMHYTIEIHFDDDYTHDRQLPFKTMDYSQLPLFIIDENETLIRSDFFVSVEGKNNLISSFLNTIGDAHLHSVFHPPQSFIEA